MKYNRNDDEEETKKDTGPQRHKKDISNLELTAAYEYYGWGAGERKENLT